MTQRAVAETVRGLIDGLVCGSFPPVQARTEVPSPGEDYLDDCPKVYIHHSPLVRTRATPPRGLGMLYDRHTLLMTVAYAFYPDATHSFRDIADGIMRALSSVTIPIRGIVDSVTGETSDIIEIGENIRYEPQPPALTEEQGMPIFVANIYAQVTECRRG